MLDLPFKVLAFMLALVLGRDEAIGWSVQKAHEGDCPENVAAAEEGTGPHASGKAGTPGVDEAVSEGEDGRCF